MTALLQAENLVKIYRRGAEEVRAVDGVSLKLDAGEMLAITGPSGSGKTTLLNLLGCLDNPDGGTLTVSGKAIFGGGRLVPESELAVFRREHFGYIFQKFYLIPTLTVSENVLLPGIFGGAPMSAPEPLLEKLGMERRANHLPGELSGGEMQRTAIARALINSPKILLADEPTGNLDSGRTEEIKEILRALARGGMAILMVTHNPDLARAADRTVEIRDGKVHAA